MEFFPSSCDALKQACMLIRLFFVGANVSLGISLVLWHHCCTYSCTYIYTYIYVHIYNFPCFNSCCLCRIRFSRHERNMGVGRISQHSRALITTIRRCQLVLLSRFASWLQHAVGYHHASHSVVYGTTIWFRCLLSFRAYSLSATVYLSIGSGKSMLFLFVFPMLSRLATYGFALEV